MFKIFPTEKFKEMKMEDNLQRRYAISNFGRLVSFEEKIENGRILKGGITDGYRVMRYKVIKEDEKTKYRCLFLYKMVAEYHLPPPKGDQIRVIHIDYDRANDKASNLKWVSQKEWLEHYKKSPYVKASNKRLAEMRRKADGPKLSETDVIFLKKKLFDPNRKTRIRILAKQYNVSEMTLYRLKSGENWGHVKIEINGKLVATDAEARKAWKKEDE